MKVRKMILRVIMVAGIPVSVWIDGLRRGKSLGSHLRRSATSASFIRFPWYIRIGLSVLIALTVVVSVSIMVGRREMTDPFSAVGDLFSGDARQVALKRGFTCQNAAWSSYAAAIADYCIQYNTDQTYSGIYLRTSGNIAEEVSLSLRENTLTLGDLVVLWGQPETRLFCETLVVSWSTQQITATVAVPRTRHVNYFAPILTISFLREGLPSWRRILLNDALHGCVNK